MGTLLELKIEQSNLGQQVINTFAFAETTPEPLTGTAFALATAFGLIPVSGAYVIGTPFKKMRDIQQNTLSYLRWTVRALYSVTDFYEAAALPGTTGNQVAVTQTSPPYVALAIKSNRVRTDVRSGSKRFAGVTENMLEAGGAVVASHLTVMQTFCDAINVALTANVAGQAYTFSTAVLPKQTADDNVGQIGEYWPTYSAQLAKSAIGLTWAPVGFARSQVSRQYGRGA